MKRRSFIVAGSAILAGGTAILAAGTHLLHAAYADGGERGVPPDLQPGLQPGDALADVEATLGGRIGVAALDTRNNARMAHRGTERFAMCSTFKWLLAAAVLAQVERTHADLDQRLAFSRNDVLKYSPVVELHLAEGAMSIKDLCQAAVEVSDNTAGNTLLKYLGGPAALTEYVRHLGDPLTRLDRFETRLNTNLPGDPRDTTTPDAMLTTMRKLLVGDGLSPPSRDRLIDWLKHCQTGLHRLRAGIPATWIVGDKTGTGDNGAANDLAIIWPPKRPPILIAAYCSSAQATPDALNAAHAQIGHLVATAFS